MEVRAIYRALAADGLHVVLLTDDVFEIVVDDYIAEYHDATYGGWDVSSIDFNEDTAVLYCKRLLRSISI